MDAGLAAARRPGMTVLFGVPPNDALLCRCSIFALAERPERRYGMKRQAEWPMCLDIWAVEAMYAQPLGSLSGQMRNIITKLLITVVPRRIAGGG
jgi:hypothetical protein